MEISHIISFLLQEDFGKSSRQQGKYISKIALKGACLKLTHHKYFSFQTDGSLCQQIDLSSLLWLDLVDIQLLVTIHNNKVIQHYLSKCIVYICFLEYMHYFFTSTSDLNGGNLLRTDPERGPKEPRIGLQRLASCTCTSVCTCLPDYLWRICPVSVSVTTALRYI